MKKEYIKEGICIWCLKGKAEGKTFLNQPHTITRQVGSTPVGFDICDECNSYFGTVGRPDLYTVSPEIALIETFHVIRFLSEKAEGSTPALRSRYFNYHPSAGTVQPKSSYALKPKFLKTFTLQFKRGLYEIFLQEYHRCTGQGLDARFSKIRDYARWGKGAIPLYFLQNQSTNHKEEATDSFSLPFNERSLQLMEEVGFYRMEWQNYIFYLEVTPQAALSRESYLKKEYRAQVGKKSSFKDLVRMESITDLGFTLQSLPTRPS